MIENNYNLHKYLVNLSWTGNRGHGTKSYKEYDRSYDVNSDGKKTLNLSSDPHFLGDKSKYNPEELFIISISSCFMLWYLHLCADNGIVVEKYEDSVTGVMKEGKNIIGKFESVDLNIKIKITDLSKKEIAIKLLKEADTKCFIANSLNFKVNHKLEFIL